jgi:hypothetical protein
MIRFSCPACGKKCKAPEAFIGKQAKCPRCGQKVCVPRDSGPADQKIIGVPPPPSPFRAVPIEETTLDTEFASDAGEGQIPEWIPEVLPAEEFSPPPVPSDKLESGPYDDEPRPRRSRRSRRWESEEVGFRCPFCQTNYPPQVMSRISTAGWVIFVILLIACFPLCIIGLFITEDYRVCSSCGIKLG